MLKPAIHNTTYYWAAWWDPALWNAINMVRYVIDTWAQKYGGGTLGPHMMQRRSAVDFVSPAPRLTVVQCLLFSSH